MFFWFAKGPAVVPSLSTAKLKGMAALPGVSGRDAVLRKSREDLP
jgi:hypothetical protein